MKANHSKVKIQSSVSEFLTPVKCGFEGGLLLYLKLTHAREDVFPQIHGGSFDPPVLGGGSKIAPVELVGKPQ